MQNKVEIKNISVKYGNEKILTNISFDILSNKPICVIGQGSSGKTTLLKTIVGLIRPSNGKVLFKLKNNLKQISNDNEISEKLGVVFQKDALFDSLTVWENVMFKSLYKCKKIINFNKSIKLLKLVGLGEDVVNLYPNELSGGMKKRVAIARAVAFNPHFLFLDEPTAGLDPVKSNKIFEIIRNLSEQKSVSVFAVSSDIKGVVKNFKEVIFLKDKKIAWKGNAKNLKSSGNKNLDDFISKSNLF